ncbi:type II secretion system protein N [Delftia sp. PS-11]|uniref:type II secretion system protein N n=1 Tax=Delftia sp. PS-11 TaxID=2767222 RepID=UPI002455BAA8|nr:type II secretion system protein N [Delftia sp. PS-11]KAJ8740815.1 general secretion pathway protein C [Delftia sp. PS-11]
MVTLSLNRGRPRLWHVRTVTFALWLLTGGVAAFWALHLAGGGVAAPVPPPAPEPLQVDAQAMARALGAVAPAATAAPVAAPVASRYALLGVLAGRDSGGGAAIIAVGSAAAKPFRVGSSVDDGVVLQSLSAREARLGPSLNGPASITLKLPQPDKP